MVTVWSDDILFGYQFSPPICSQHFSSSSLQWGVLLQWLGSGGLLSAISVFPNLSTFSKLKPLATPHKKPLWWSSNQNFILPHLRFLKKVSCLIYRKVVHSGTVNICFPSPRYYVGAASPLGYYAGLPLEGHCVCISPGANPKSGDVATQVC